MTTANTSCGLREQHDPHRMGAEGTLTCDGSPFKWGSNYQHVGKDWACCGLPISGPHLPNCNYSKPRYGIVYERVEERIWGPGDFYHVYHGTITEMSPDGHYDLYLTIEENTMDHGRSEREKLRNIVDLLNAQEEAEKAKAVAESTEG